MASTLSQDITAIVFAAIDDINRQFRPTDRLEKSLDTVLIGAGTRLDSLRLVNFMLSIEQRIAKHLNKKVNLFSPQYLTSDSITPLTVALLVQTIVGDINA